MQSVSCSVPSSVNPSQSLSSPSHTSVVGPVTAAHTGAPVVGSQLMTRPTRHSPTAPGTKHPELSACVQPVLQIPKATSKLSPEQHSDAPLAVWPPVRQAAQTPPMTRRSVPQHTRTSVAFEPSATHV